MSNQSIHIYVTSFHKSHNSYRETNNFLNLESEAKLRQRVEKISTNVKVENILVQFKCEASTSISNIATKLSPVAYIQNLDEFMLAYLDNLVK